MLNNLSSLNAHIGIGLICPLSVLLAAVPVFGVPTEKVEKKAVANLSPTEGNHARGEISFLEKEEETQIIGQVTGLTPGLHGIHIHQFGDCSGDGESAGAHFNPGDAKHSGPHTKSRHAGDLGNIEANAEGLATIALDVKGLKLSGSNSIIGRSLIVHEKADDLESQPAGDSGKRLTCGVIQMAKVN